MVQKSSPGQRDSFQREAFKLGSRETWRPSPASSELQAGLADDCQRPGTDCLLAALPAPRYYELVDARVVDLKAIDSDEIRVNPNYLNLIKPN